VTQKKDMLKRKKPTEVTFWGKQRKEERDAGVECRFARENQKTQGFPMA